MKNGRKYIVWSNDINIDDWDDYVSVLKEENPKITEDQIWDEIEQLNQEYLYDERANTKGHNLYRIINPYLSNNARKNCLIL